MSLASCPSLSARFVPAAARASRAAALRPAGASRPAPLPPRAADALTRCRASPHAAVTRAAAAGLPAGAPGCAGGRARVALTYLRPAAPLPFALRSPQTLLLARSRAPQPSTGASLLPRAHRTTPRPRACTAHLPALTPARSRRQPASPAAPWRPQRPTATPHRTISISFASAPAAAACAAHACPLASAAKWRCAPTMQLIALTLRARRAISATLQLRACAAEPTVKP